MGLIILLAVIASATWVAIDANQLGVRRGQMGGGVLDLSPAAWCACCLLLWIVAFPAYLTVRPRLVAMSKARATHAPAYAYPAGAVEPVSAPIATSAALPQPAPTTAAPTMFTGGVNRAPNTPGPNPRLVIACVAASVALLLILVIGFQMKTIQDAQSRLDDVYSTGATDDAASQVAHSCSIDRAADGVKRSTSGVQGHLALWTMKALGDSVDANSKFERETASTIRGRVLVEATLSGQLTSTVASCNS